MNTAIKVLLLFLAITGLSTILMQSFAFDFGTIDYWKNHGVFFLIFLTLFPRLTLLFSSVASGGVFWWVAWLFAPRFLVAFLATIGYWKTNPILVMVAWFVALSGETSEKTFVINKGRPYQFKRTVIINGKRYEQASEGFNQTKSSHPSMDGNTIEADFTVKKESDS
jgi:hypothetical protein